MDGEWGDGVMGRFGNRTETQLDASERRVIDTPLAGPHCTESTLYLHRVTSFSH